MKPHRYRFHDPRAALDRDARGHYTEDTVFPENDHRRHRPRSWLINGIKKIETLQFLEQPERTLGQAALQWLLPSRA